jgi:ribokinase
MSYTEEFYPAVLFLPIRIGERVRFVTSLFSSPAVVEVLNLFELGKELCQRDIVKALSHRSNKTIIDALKKLVSLGLLSESVRKVERGDRRVRVKCYNLTEIGRWYVALFRDPREFEPPALHQLLEELFAKFMEKFVELAKRVDISEKEVCQHILASTLRVYSKRLYKSYDLAVFGSLAYDIYLSPSPKAFSGGSGANVAFTAAKLGLRTAFVTAIPMDLLGVKLAIELAESGVDISFSKPVQNLSTTICTALHQPAGRHRIECVHDSRSPPVVTELTPEVVRVCSKARALYLGEGIGRVFKELLEAVGRDKLVVYRPPTCTFRSGEAFEEFLEVLSYSPLLILNEDKVEVLREKGLSIPQDMFKYGVKSLIVTLGPRGAELYTAPGTQPKRFQAPQVEAVDTIGAGDVFSATLIYKLLGGAGLEEAVEFAVKIAALSTKELGPRKTQVPQLVKTL